MIDSYEANLDENIIEKSTFIESNDDAAEDEDNVDDNGEIKPKSTNFGTNSGPQALILTPTRELAIQIKDHLQTCCKYQNTKVKSKKIISVYLLSFSEHEINYKEDYSTEKFTAN